MSDLTKALTEALSAHLIEQVTGHYRRGGKWKILCTCGCTTKFKGDPQGDEAAHAAHLATTLAPVIAEAQAVALEEAADAWPMAWPLAGHDWLRDRAAKTREAGE
ncbi:hypothetical protein ACQCSX_04330 [Pseudarthrobacter sp. P1]|uniref:hypothetical protein n=1 Tax=Pseudarthrobacter sp. P1 TaxID=3418418 RepID=UPI003CE85959